MLDLDFSPAQAPILVASDSVADAELVASILKDEFNNVLLSVEPEDAVTHFEAHRPAVLILAFDTLNAADQYYCSLSRSSVLVHEIPYRTLILCNKNEVWQTYELCKKERFDDYVLFWPITNDAPRLKMAIHHAMRRLKETALAPVTAGELAIQVRSLASLEDDLRGSVGQIGRDLDMVGLTVSQAEELAHRTRHLSPNATTTVPHIVHERGHLGTGNLEELMCSVSAAIGGLQQRATEIEERLTKQLEPVRKALKLSQRVRSTILIVEDDEFQRKLISRLLAGQDIDLLLASSGSEAMTLLWQRRANVILMDVGLPDINGVELTRRIRNIANFSEVQIVMITGHSERHIVVDSLRAGATDFLVKPLDRQRLLEKLRNFLPPRAGMVSISG